MNLCMHPLSSTFSIFLGRPPKSTPLPPSGRRTRWRLPYFQYGMGLSCLQTFWGRSTNSVCNENILVLNTSDRWNLVLQDRPIHDKRLHFDHVRAYVYEKHDLARNDHGSLWTLFRCICFSNHGPDDILSFLEFSHICGHEVFPSWLRILELREGPLLFNETSFGHCFFQEMPACAIGDAFTPVW